MKYRHILIGLNLFLLLTFPATLVAAQGGTTVNWAPKGNKSNSEYLEIKKFPTDPLSKFGMMGDVWTEPSSGMEFVWVEGGCFTMGNTAGKGDSDEQQHQVCLDGYWIGKYEVTQAEWSRIMGRNPSEQRGDRYPVEMVSWYDAKSFVKRLNAKGTGYFALPSEAQWEYAARSRGRDDRFPGGSDPNQVAWFTPTSGNRKHEVGTKAPNHLGIHDMAGNVWEWCEDVYNASAYSRHSGKNPVFTGSGSDRVERGGSYRSGDASIRSANRFKAAPGKSYNNLGFRVVRTR